MNYQKIYDEIIERAKLRGLNKKLLDGYYEKHHIIPRCMNGTNDKSNLVLLTGREHYLCHYLLWQTNKENKSLFFAYKMMTTVKTKNQKRKAVLSSKQYEIIKINRSKLMLNENNPKYGLKSSEETKIKQSESMKKYYKFNDHPMIGRKHSDETKLKMSNAAKNRKYNPFLGKTHSDIFKEKLKNIHKGNSYAARRCIVNNIEFDTISDAAKYLNISYPTMISRLKSDKYTSINYLS